MSTAEPDGREQRPPLWEDDPAPRRRLPDPVRTAAVRAALVVAVTLVEAMIAFLCTLAGSWLAFPMVLGGVAGTVVATWCVLDVWVTRQVWTQRNGVVSTPSSSARQRRKERRRARRAARHTPGRIRRPAGRRPRGPQPQTQPQPETETETEPQAQPQTQLQPQPRSGHGRLSPSSRAA